LYSFTDLKTGYLFCAALVGTLMVGGMLISSAVCKKYDNSQTQLAYNRKQQLSLVQMLKSVNKPVAILFLAVLIVLSLMTGLLDLIFTLPVLRSANMLLGFLLGVVEAAFFACLLATVMSVLIQSLGAIDPGTFGTDVVDDTIICRFVLKHNMLERLMSALGWN
ncbi:MAG: CvpA family protein, partial [Clostridia bacterium]|nr:CvpA family protein [Clostridia bacterium]